MVFVLRFKPVDVVILLFLVFDDESDELTFSGRKKMYQNLGPNRRTKLSKLPRKKPSMRKRPMVVGEDKVNAKIKMIKAMRNKL